MTPETNSAITAEQAKDTVQRRRGELGTIIRIAAKGRTSLTWHHKTLAYVVLSNKKVTHRGTDPTAAVAAYHQAAARG
jgi:hypothetical protein